MSMKPKDLLAVIFLWGLFCQQSNLWDIREILSLFCRLQNITVITLFHKLYITEDIPPYMLKHNTTLSVTFGHF